MEKELCNGGIFFSVELNCPLWIQLQISSRFYRWDNRWVSEVSDLHFTCSLFQLSAALCQCEAFVNHFVYFYTVTLCDSCLCLIHEPFAFPASFCFPIVTVIKRESYVSHQFPPNWRLLYFLKEVTCCGFGAKWINAEKNTMWALYNSAWLTQ